MTPPEEQLRLPEVAPPQNHHAEGTPASQPRTRPETPVRSLRLTIPTGWHRDAPSSLFLFSEIPPVNDLTSHIANHDVTRRMEMAPLTTANLRWLHSAILHELEQRATGPLPRANAHQYRALDQRRPYSYHHQTLHGAPDVRKALRSTTPPVICTLVLPLPPEGAPMQQDHHQRIPLPTMGPANITNAGLASLARTFFAEVRERERILRLPGPQGP